METQRLLIRPISIDDYPFIYKLVNSEGWLKYIGDRQVNSRNDAKNYIQRIIDNLNFSYYVLVLKNTNEPIGIISFLKRDTEKFPDFGFAILPEYQRQGFTYEASRHFIDTALSKEERTNLIAITASDNEASIKLLNRLGFRWSANKNENNEITSYFSLANQTTR